jgi:hypothetical protein
VVNHRGVDKRLESLLTAGACEVAGGALFWHALSRLIGGNKILFVGENSFTRSAHCLPISRSSALR